MSSCWATRRASSTSATLQQPVSLSPPHRRIVTPTTSWPSRRKQRGGDRRVDAAAHRDHHLHAAAAARPRARRSVRTADVIAVDRAVDVGGRSSCARASGAARRRPIAVDAHRGEHVRRVHRPARARRRRRRADAGLVEQVQQRLALDALDEDVGRAGDLVGRRRPSRGRRARRRRARRRGGRAGRRCARPRRPARRRSPPSAAARATMPATLWVPLRRSRSWPPPTISGSIAAPSRTASTPTPFGPPNLWALSDSRSTCGHTSRRSSQLAACTASVCSSARGARVPHDGSDRAPGR